MDTIEHDERDWKAPEVAEETIFSVLAGRARTRAPFHLWLTAGIGVIDAIALSLFQPNLWWVAAAFGAVSAYATWGLADRALGDGTANPNRLLGPKVLRGIRGLVVVVGLACAVAAVIGFLGVSLGRSGPPG